MTPWQTLGCNPSSPDLPTELAKLTVLHGPSGLEAVRDFTLTWEAEQLKLPDPVIETVTPWEVV